MPTILIYFLKATTWVHVKGSVSVADWEVAEVATCHGWSKLFERCNPWIKGHFVCPRRIYTGFYETARPKAPEKPGAGFGAGRKIPRSPGSHWPHSSL